MSVSGLTGSATFSMGKMPSWSACVTLWPLLP